MNKGIGIGIGAAVVIIFIVAIVLSDSNNEVELEPSISTPETVEDTINQEGKSLSINLSDESGGQSLP